MPMFFIQNIQQVSYWEAQVSKYGVDALKSEQIIGYRLTKGKRYPQMVWGRDARPDPVAGRVFPKRDAVPTEDRLFDFATDMTTANHAQQNAVANSVNMGLRQQQMLAEVQIEVAREELDQQSKMLNEILIGENSNPEIDNSSLLDEVWASKYPEVRVPASLAVVKNLNIGMSRRMRLCSTAQAEAKALAEKDSTDEKWSVYTQFATAELEEISRHKENRRKRKERSPRVIKQPHRADQ
ncbi:hypothetical protein DL98DRAFT_591224 [Cadophora sp. DSE1049]|nr:hypothetical protein DL98DRAFT_591224 [Cadophora sp. DSE1049]